MTITKTSPEHGWKSSTTKRSFYVFAFLVTILGLAIPAWDPTVIKRVIVGDPWDFPKRAWIYSLQKSPLLRKWQFPEEPYKVHLLATEPLMIHIENFITKPEREYLLWISKSRLRPSKVVLNNGTLIPSPGRTSSTATLPMADPVVRTITKRATDFQGFGPFRFLDLQVTAYKHDQFFHQHYDWQGTSKKYNRTRDRLSTFFAILEAECTKCGTEFPYIGVNWTEEDQTWCKFMDCDEENLITRNVPGAAIFWRNLDEDLRGRQDVMHAGLPSKNGTKTGLNIWTWVDVPPRDDEDEEEDDIKTVYGDDEEEVEEAREADKEEAEMAATEEDKQEQRESDEKRGMGEAADKAESNI